MKQIIVALIAILLSNAPAQAQDNDTSSLLERGAQQFLEDLLKEMEPAWAQMQDFMDAMGPAMLELMEEIKDWSAYDPPEVLENGDIILRRKTPQEPEPAAPDEPPAHIEL